MGNRSSSAVVAAVAALLAATPAAQGPPPPAAPPPAPARPCALQRESDALASREQSLLVDPRKLEVERELKSAELARVEENLAATNVQIQAIVARAAALHDTAEAERPDVEARLVQIYKLGHAGYWRLLLDIEDLQSVGRAYRTAAALTRIDRDRVQQHARTLAALARERQALETKAVDITKLQEQAGAARAAIERAVAARTALT